MKQEMIARVPFFAALPPAEIDYLAAFAAPM